MQNKMLEYCIDYLKSNTSFNKQVINGDLDIMLQEEFSLRSPLGDGKIREIIHDIRIHYNIENEDGLPFFIYGEHVKTKILSSRTGNFKDIQMNKKELRDYLIQAYENGANIII